ncbi:hypothetical protein LSH36_104g02046 [Paralvinella palmiformis]|uniref:Methyltransferase FkbM domain-containing protein n=1 Tax=Paralvinella palmiformis TaxID=53620 RepID=A0AAD9K031_9ANNE|nr:hypothetical protein LSH36_104g02046 [Paralvinella palmiformis]
MYAGVCNRGNAYKLCVRFVLRSPVMAFTTRRMLLGSVLAVGGILFLAVASVNRNLKCATCRLKDADSFSLVDVSRRADDLCHIPSTCRAPEADRQRELADVMTGYTGSRISASDAGLIDRIRKHFIDLPRPYVTKFSMPIVETPQAKEVSRILKHKKQGFFVECGALDGERSSNTIWLEQKQSWNGLLIEMDPSYYLQVRGKNRKCYSINACLSPEEYPIKMQFKEHTMGEGRLVTDTKISQQDQHLIHDSYCFPLYSLMLALNRTRIDYFSLDVEGMELPILKSIPFDKLDIAVLTVEYKHGKDKSEYADFMRHKGYKKVKELNFFIKELYLGGCDFVFVREDLL